MKNKKDFQIFLDKVPALRTGWKIVLTIVYLLGLIVSVLLFFYFIDPLRWYMPLVTQLIMALIVTLIAYVHFKIVNKYRRKYGKLAYQSYFYHFMLPYLVAWYALVFHPLFISGPALLPFFVAIIIAIIFFVITILVSIHIERAGFKTITHGMDLYTVFPEEATIVRGEIYAYVRHPLYLSLTCACISLAFVANNLIAIIASLLQIIPCIIAGKLEDKELIERSGEEHVTYIQNTALLFPFRKVIGFLKLLFFFKS
ncbi:MAG: methyltransferase family protein [Candidatus Hermodarchaeota archaeon]